MDAINENRGLLDDPTITKLAKHVYVGTWHNRVNNLKHHHHIRNHDIFDFNLEHNRNS